MREKKDGRVALDEATVRNSVLQGALEVAAVVGTTYGPKGKNVLVEKDFGRPVLTRDGVTVARDCYFSDRDKQLGAAIVLEAAETTNRIAGDATTATTLLTANLLKSGVQAIAANNHPMDIKATLVADSYKILARLDELTTPVAKGQLVQVATVSSGDPLLGEMIATAVERVGADGGIITEKHPIEEVECEFVDGYYLQSGFQALEASKKQLVDPVVLVSIRRLSSAADANELLTKTIQSIGITPEALQAGNIPRVLLMGNIEDQAYNFICGAINRGAIDAIIIKTPPRYGEMGKQLLEDLAVYAGCEPITDNTNLREFSRTYVGKVTKAVASKTESTLFADNETEQVRDRIQLIKDQISTETVDAILEKYKDRVAKLEGKIALFRIGGATDTVKEEVEFRVEDAINSTRAALSHGVVVGGGVTLVELSKLDISDAYRQALRDTFQRLLINANLPAELKLDQLLKAPLNYGFNLRDSGELTDLVAAGILDPKLAVEQVIKRATAAASDALTIGAGLVFESKED